jgi:hypothetical protein
MLQFVIGVESEFYPQLDALYRCRIESWARHDKQTRMRNSLIPERPLKGRSRGGPVPSRFAQRRRNSTRRSVAGRWV